MKLRPLLNTFRKDDYDFCLLSRSGEVGKPSVALYQKINPLHVQLYLTEQRTHLADHFEVILVQQARETYWEHSGVTTPARELPPSAESWGKQGWSFTTREAAEWKFDQLAEGLEDAPKKAVKMRKKGKVSFGG
jgi:hypothetical protein